MMYLFTYEHTHIFGTFKTVYSNEPKLSGKTGDYKKVYQYARASASELGTVYFKFM